MEILYCDNLDMNTMSYASFNYIFDFNFHTNILENQIKDLDAQLEDISPVRNAINRYKHKKDDLVTRYIKTRTYTQNIDIDYINYRALVKQFRSIFENPYKIDMMHFGNNKIHTNHKLEALRSLIGAGIYCKTDEIQFPHLIGIKTNPPTINSIKEFINNIHYEQDIIEDYSSHGADIDKLKSFGWIQNTIEKPDYVFLQDAITTQRLNCDIAFVKKITGNSEFIWHVVCMKKREYTFKNNPVYAINSQFPKNIGRNLQFDQNKAVFVRNN